MFGQMLYGIYPTTYLENNGGYLSPQYEESINYQPIYLALILSTIIICVSLLVSKKK